MINEFNTRGLFYCNNKNLAYLKINKCGCSSIGSWISKFKTASPKQPIWNGKNSSYNFHYVTEDETELSNFFTFTFVRDPFKRFLSYYKDFIVNRNAPGVFNRYGKFGIKEDMKFEDFVEKIVQIEDLSVLDHHLAPMYTFVFRENTPRVKFIGKLENLNDLRYIELFSDSNIKIPHANKTSNHKNKNYYTPETCALIYNYYRKDFELFGYDKYYPQYSLSEKEDTLNKLTNTSFNGLHDQLAQAERKLNNVYSSKTYKFALKLKQFLSPIIK